MRNSCSLLFANARKKIRNPAPQPDLSDRLEALSGEGLQHRQGRRTPRRDLGALGRHERDEDSRQRARHRVPAVRFVHSLNCDDDALSKRVEAEKKQFAGIELPQQTLGVIGLGKIGSLVADAAIKLGMNVLGYDPEITVDAAWSLPSQVKKAHSIEEILKASQFVTLHVPLLPVTRHLINAKNLELMHAGSILLNFSREEIVDAKAIAAALASKKLKYYVTDFPAQPLCENPAVLALPHLGASTREAEENSAVMVVDQVRDYLENGNIQNAVNFPDVVMGRESPYRVAIANANVPNMVDHSKGEMAYTLVDVDSPVNKGLVEGLARIKGVLAVRYLPTS